MINVVSIVKSKEGKSTGSSGGGFASTVVYNGGVEKHTLWGQTYNGRNDVEGDMTVNGSLFRVNDITASGQIKAPYFFQAGYPVLDSSNSHVNDGSVTIYNVTKYFLGTNANGEVTKDAVFLGNADFRKDVTITGSLKAKDVSTGYIWANSGHITDLDASAINAKDITTEYLTVTKKAHFFSLVIDEVKSVGGQLVVSPANATIDLVETLANGNYRCYFRAKDNDGKQIHNQFDVNDQVVCQTFDVAEGTSYNVSNKYYWRLVVGVYSGVVTKTIEGQDYECHYLDISATDYDQGSDIPEAGDKIALLGNRTDTQRQDAIIISAYDSQWLDPEIKAPSIVQYKGINSYELKSFRMNQFAANGNVIRGTLIVESGDNVEDLIDNATTGLKSYVHIAYSNSSSDWTKDKTRAGEGWKYLGIVSNYTEDETNLNYTDYRWTLIKGTDGQGVSDVVEWYLASASATGVKNTDDGWTKDPQQMTEVLKYLWNYEEFKYSNGNSVKKDAHVIGVYGEGHKVSSIDNYYLATNLSSGVTVNTAGWTPTYQAPTATKKYVWNYEVINYSNGDKSTIAPHIIGAYGDTGNDGSTGATGNGISSITEYYLATSYSSGVTRSNGSWGTWSTGIQTISESKQFLWNYEDILYTNGNHFKTDPVIIGRWGKDGSSGRGIVKVTEWYLATSYSSGVTRSNGAWGTWSKDVQTITPTKKYLWNYEEVEYTDGTEYTDPVIIGAYGQQGPSGDDTEMYRLLDLGSSSVIDIDDKMYLNLNFGVMYINGGNAFQISQGDTDEWAGVDAFYYKLNYESTWHAVTAQAQTGKFIVSSTISNFTTNHPSGAYVTVRLDANGSTVDQLSMPITINPGTYFSTINGLTSRVSANETSIRTIDGSIGSLSSSVTSVTNRVSAIEQDIDSIDLRVQETETDIDNLSGTVSGHTTKISNLEVSIGGISTTVSNVSNKLNNMNIGATNMLRETKTIDASFCTLSSNAQKAANAYLGFTRVYSYHASNNTSYIDPMKWSVTLRPNTEYTLSFYAYGSGKMTCYLYPDACAKVIGSQGQTTTNADGNTEFTLSSTWTRYWVTFTTKSSVSGAKNVLIGRQLQNTYAYEYICAPKFEMGNVNTDWSPHPDDAEAKISSLSSSVSSIQQTANSISSRVEAIEGNYVTSTQLTQTSNSITSSVNAYTDAQIAAIDMSDAKKVTIDATGYSADNAYPVVIDMNGYNGPERIRCQVKRTLNSAYGVPSYSTHQNGFVVDLDWYTRASGWGTNSVAENWSTSDRSRYINSFELNYVTSGAKVVGNIGQITQNSEEIVYVRGGSKYDVLCSYKDASIFLDPTHTWSATGSDGQNYSASRTYCPQTALIVPVCDALGRSEIQQTADNIKLSVYNELEERTGIDVTNGSITLNAATTTVVGNLNLTDTNNGLTVYDSSGVPRINLQPKAISSVAPNTNDTYDVYTWNLTYAGNTTQGPFYYNDVSEKTWYLYPESMMELDSLHLTLTSGTSYPSSYYIYATLELIASSVRMTYSLTFTRTSNGYYNCTSTTPLRVTNVLPTAGANGSVFFKISDYSTTSDRGKSYSSRSLYARIRTSRIVQTYIGTDGFYSHPGAYQLFKIDSSSMTMQSGFNGLKLVASDNTSANRSLYVAAGFSGTMPNIKPYWVPFYNYTPVTEIGGYEFKQTTIYYDNKSYSKYVYTIEPKNLNGILHVSSRPLDSNGNQQSEAWIRLPDVSGTVQDIDGNYGAIPNGYSITIINDLSDCTLYVVPYRSSSSNTLYSGAIRDANRQYNQYFEMSGSQNCVTKFIKISAYSPYNTVWFADKDT